MSIGAPTDPDLLSEAQSRKFMRVIDDDTGLVVQLELVDTGRTAGDGTPIYAMGTVPSSPAPASIKKSPYIGQANVAANGTAEPLCQVPIVSATIATDIITIARDWTDFISVGDEITIYQSTGNDGTYTVVAATFGAGVTSIELETGDIVDATADGKVTLAEIIIMSAVVQAESTNTGSIFLGDSFIASGLGIELTAGEMAIIEAGPYPIDLIEHYIDAAVNTDGVTWYILG